MFALVWGVCCNFLVVYALVYVDRSRAKWDHVSDIDIDEAFHRCFTAIFIFQTFKKYKEEYAIEVTILLMVGISNSILVLVANKPKCLPLLYIIPVFGALIPFIPLVKAIGLDIQMDNQLGIIFLLGACTVYLTIILAALLKHQPPHVEQERYQEEGEATCLEMEAMHQPVNTVNISNDNVNANALIVDCPPEYPGSPGQALPASEVTPPASAQNNTQPGIPEEPPAYSVDPPSYSEAVQEPEQEENIDDYALSEISEAPSYASTLPPGHLRIQSNRNNLRRFDS